MSADQQPDGPQDAERAPVEPGLPGQSRTGEHEGGTGPPEGAGNTVDETTSYQLPPPAAPPVPPRLPAAPPPPPRPSVPPPPRMPAGPPMPTGAPRVPPRPVGPPAGQETPPPSLDPPAGSAERDDSAPAAAADAPAAAADAPDIPDAPDTPDTPPSSDAPHAADAADAPHDADTPDAPHAADAADAAEAADRAPDGASRPSNPVVKPANASAGRGPSAPAASRRGLLLAAGGGLVGALAGAAGVAGWVIGRGGGTEALTAPYPGADTTSVAPEPVPVEPAPGAPPAALWRYDSQLESAVPPLVWEQRLVILADSFQAVCIDLATGEEVWRDGDFRVSGLYLDVDLYLVRHGDTVVRVDLGSLIAIDPETGAERWAEERYGVDTEVDFGPRLERIESSAEDGTSLMLRAQVFMDLADAEELAEQDGDAERNATSSGDRVRVMVLSLYDSEVREQRWYQPLVGATDFIAWQNEGIEEARLLVVYGERRELIAYRLSDGEVAWRDPLEDYQDHRLSLLGGERLAAHSGNTVAVYDYGSGTELWSATIGSDDEAIGSVFEVDAEGETEEDSRVLYLTQGNSWIAAFDAASGEEIYRTQVRDHRLSQGESLNLRPTSTETRLTAGTTADLTVIDSSLGEPLWRFQRADQHERSPGDSYTGYAADDVLLVWDGTVAYGFPLD